MILGSYLKKKKKKKNQCTDFGKSNNANNSQLSECQEVELQGLPIHEARHDKTCLREFPIRPDTNRPAQP